jgi:hypothetical protein
MDISTVVYPWVVGAGELNFISTLVRKEISTPITPTKEGTNSLSEWERRLVTVKCCPFFAKMSSLFFRSRKSNIRIFAAQSARILLRVR